MRHLQKVGQKRGQKRRRLFLTHLHVREEHLEHVGARVAGVEKHELGLLEMVGGEALLDLNMAAVKDTNNCWENEGGGVGGGGGTTSVRSNTLGLWLQTRPTVCVLMIRHVEQRFAGRRREEAIVSFW